MGELVPVHRDDRTPTLRERPWTESRWDPFRDFDELWERMAGRFLSWPAPGGWPREWTPMMDVEETEDAWLIELDLPGVAREDIDIQAADRQLTVQGEIKERERVGILRHRTRRTGRFSYQTTLPAGVDPDRIEARYDNGVLTVKVPRPEQSRSRKIKID